MVALAVVAAAMLAWRHNDYILYNPSNSVPRGFYVRRSEPLQVGTFVTVRARDVARDYASERDFVDSGDRFLKRVAALEGDHVCAEGGTVTVNEHRSVHRQRTDSASRTLPRWNGCRVLQRQEVLLLGDTEDSFDGRYWGPVSVHLIEGFWAPMMIFDERGKHRETTTGSKAR